MEKLTDDGMRNLKDAEKDRADNGEYQCAIHRDPEVEDAVPQDGVNESRHSRRRCRVQDKTDVFHRNRFPDQGIQSVDQDRANHRAERCKYPLQADLRFSAGLSPGKDDRREKQYRQADQAGPEKPFCRRLVKPLVQARVLVDFNHDLQTEEPRVIAFENRAPSDRFVVGVVDGEKDERPYRKFT
jgi:hypothetical protein